MSILLIDITSGRYAIVEVDDNVDMLEAASVAAYQMIEEIGENGRIIIFASKCAIESLTDQVVEYWSKIAEAVNANKRTEA